MIKRIIYSNNLLFKVYFNLFYKPKGSLSKFLNTYSKQNKNKLFFIQIGANDGQWNDPIYKFIRRDNWKGILFEPQKDIFETLLKNYKGIQGLTFENSAIDATVGKRDFYRIGFTNARWASGLSSFQKEDVQRMIDAGYIDRKCTEEGVSPPPDKQDWIIKVNVNINTIANVINKYNLRKINLIMIDTEGYDFEIIKTIPFDVIKPEVIIYEHTHFSNETKTECIHFLKGNNYKISHTISDTIAILE